MNNVEFLKAVRAIIDKGWCQRAFARTKEGWHTLSGASDATNHCLVGAARAVDPTSGFDRIHHLLLPKIYHLSEWNDDPRRTKDQVLALLDETIKEVK